MVKVGIDTLAIYTSRYALELSTLAAIRNTDPDKYQIGLGQMAMSVLPPGEDIVTMAASAAKEALRDINTADIDLLLFATESGIDQSKAAGLYLHELLALPERCRVLELKQACYSATGALQLALPYLLQNPNKKVLLVASDVARYGLGTSGESSQGCAAAAMVLSTQPRLMSFDLTTGFISQSVMDFWRPNYLHEALVEGKYSSKLYLTSLEKSWLQYRVISGFSFGEHDYFCYHTPVPRLVEKAHQHLLKINGVERSSELANFDVEMALQYGRIIGNSYTAALYVSFASLLDHAKNLSHKRIGFYSYGSGCVAEFFSGVIEPGYEAVLKTAYHQHLIKSREILDYLQYESFYNFNYVENGDTQFIPLHKVGAFRLTKMEQHKRIYEPVSVTSKINVIKTQEKKPEFIRVYAPGKLILSGEHSVVYGEPALAMAINRYVTTTLSKEQAPHVAFNLADLAHQSHLSFNALHHLKARVKEKYHRFLQGDFSIREVLLKPFELAQFALSMLSEKFHKHLPQGMNLHVQSDLPIGCGMGSSAATVLSVLHAALYYLKTPLTKEELFQLALEAEKMQHGYSSGLDLKIAMQGGCHYVTPSSMEVREIPTLPLYFINTGTPLSTTGQCVEKVKPHFKSNSLIQEFGAVTKAFDEALKQQSWLAIQEAILANHQLLTKIGVVPPRVQAFVNEVESLNGAAKICGAGAVCGDNAGAVIATVPDSALLYQLCGEYGYNVIPIFGETRGVHAA